MKNVVLILASGTGSRCGLDYPKQFAQIKGKSVLQHTVEKFQNNKNIDEIYLVTNFEYVEKVKSLTEVCSKVVSVVTGGETRKDSSYNGVFSINHEECNVLIHDGVRPLVSDTIIETCVEALNLYPAVCVAIDSTDTIYLTDSNNVILDVPNRKNLKRAQTPQCFKLSLIKKAHELAKNDTSCLVTDDCGLVMHYKLANVYTVEGSEMNIKVTYQDDLDFAEKYL